MAQTWTKITFITFHFFIEVVSGETLLVENQANGTGDDGGKLAVVSVPPLVFIALLSCSTYSSPQLWLSLSLYEWERVCMKSCGSTRANSPCRLHLSGGLRILKHFNNRLRLRLQLLQLGHNCSPLFS